MGSVTVRPLEIEWGLIYTFDLQLEEISSYVLGLPATAERGLLSNILNVYKVHHLSLGHPERGMDYYRSCYRFIAAVN